MLVISALAHINALWVSITMHKHSWDCRDPAYFLQNWDCPYPNGGTINISILILICILHWILIFVSHSTGKPWKNKQTQHTRRDYFSKVWSAWDKHEGGDCSLNNKKREKSRREVSYTSRVQKVSPRRAFLFFSSEYVSHWYFPCSITFLIAL